MDIQSLTQWTGLVAALAPALMVLGGLWMIWRTESLHIITRRLWLLVHGSQDISDPAIRAFVEEQSSLMAFRMFSGIRADTLDEAHQLMEWATSNHINLRVIASCGDYFDVQRRVVNTHKLPSPASQWARGALASVGMALFMACALAASVSKVAFSFKSDDSWFLADATSARAIWSTNAWFGEPLTQTACKQSPLPTRELHTFKAGQIAMVCDLLTQDDWPRDFSLKLSAQRMAFALLAVFILWLAWVLGLSWRSVLAARKLADRNADPALLGAQLNLDFSP